MWTAFATSSRGPRRGSVDPPLRGICTLGFEGTFQQPAKVRRDWLRFPPLAIVRQLNAFRSRQHATAPILGDLITQREARMPAVRRPRGHLALTAPSRLRLPVDVAARQAE